MKRTLLAVFVLALSLALAGAAFAQGRGMRGGPGMGPMCDMTRIPGLNLSADQSAKINALQAAHLKDALPVRNQLQIKRLELRQLWLEKSPDQAKIEAKQKEIQDLRSQLFSKQTSYRLAALKELTPEQQDKVKAASWGCPRFSGKGSPRGRGMGPGMGRGPGANL